MAQSKWSELEEKHGKSIEDLLQDAFARHKTQSAVARALGVNQSTVFGWLLKLDLDIEVRLVPRAAKRDGGEGHVSAGQMSFLG